jgi:mannose-6-phosphate isomerase-like protein (cupin superfamily)
MRRCTNKTATCFTTLSFLSVLACASVGNLADDGFQSWQLEELADRQAESGKPYLSFLDAESMHCGIYVLPAGAEDKQQPHDEDEIYVVEAGVAKFTAGSETVDIEPGAILFVPAQLPHRFHDIRDDLRLIVFFSKAKPGDESDRR